MLVMFALSIGLLIWSSFALYCILRLRQALFSFWDGKTGEEVWGFGQVSALFAWAPVLAKLGDPAFTLLGKSLHSNTPTVLPEATSGAGSDLHI